MQEKIIIKKKTHRITGIKKETKNFDSLGDIML